MKHKHLFLLLLPLTILFGFLLVSQTAKAEPYKNYDQFYDYSAVATIKGTWGANLFINNDHNKQFDKILPKDSQWQIYGYTKRKDGFYYWAGGDQWIQANQAMVPVDNASDAILNAIAQYKDSGDPDTYWVPIHIVADYGNDYRGGYWGTDYWWVRDEGPRAASFKQSFVVYPNGNAFKLPAGGPY
ncbi:hypothetical protein FC83_GL000277 [Agrilactobacillus composti DSM 18527 = JCM 14202]|uniref:Surface layer protein A domain-containing protein n=1 Tax=Agrilactobacillus composti DSM 18527 = JCM 14202 TaxID=1423734 RepID=X0PV77_9LACO|nr:hypothetical protein [Agrilactobacillus composti]KRM32712.1 hypothetical protein FC83_GL000277 [Agrilactobacillus composti DSM 18527 = JCM 14202]GAF42052.1 hypothetical protein JCM14202_4051 [Agrilactobacillus composti DSM 18527 = JCM 14202]